MAVTSSSYNQKERTSPLETSRRTSGLVSFKPHELQTGAVVSKTAESQMSRRRTHGTFDAPTGSNGHKLGHGRAGTRNKLLRGRQRSHVHAGDELMAQLAVLEAVPRDAAHLEAPLVRAGPVAHLELDLHPRGRVFEG